MTRDSQRRSRAAGIAFGAYKAIVSPVLHAFSPSRCVYLPTCSEYAYIAVNRFGFLRGSWIALRRVARCHPWSKGGFDPVPGRDAVAGIDGNPAEAGAVPAKSAEHLP